MYLSDSEVWYNKTWCFLQFKVYEMSFDKMSMLVDNLANDNHNPLPFTCNDNSKLWFNRNKFSNNKFDCILLQIEITKEQYSLLTKTKFYQF